MALPYPGMDFTSLDILTAADMDKIVANIEYLNDGFRYANTPANNIQVPGPTIIQSITLTPGTWMVLGGFRFSYTRANSTPDYQQAGFKYGTTASSSTIKTYALNTMPADSNSVRVLFNMTHLVTVTTPSYPISTFAEAAREPATGQVGTCTANTCYLYAIRVA